MEDTLSLAEIRGLYGGRISNMEPKLLHMYFETVYRELERRASGNSYEHMTVDNLTFLRESIRDDNSVKGNALVRSKWAEQYGSYFKDLEWRFYTVSDYVKFHASFAEKNPNLPCVVSLFTVEDGELSKTHPSSCRLSGGQYRGCDICNILYALDMGRSQTEGVESELKRRCDEAGKYGDTKKYKVMFNGVGLSLTCLWDETSRRPSMLEVSGPLGVVLRGIGWEHILNVDNNLQSSAYEMEMKEAGKPTGWLREYLLQGAIESEAKQLEREKEALRKKKEDETPPPDAHVICMHDVSREGFIHWQKDRLCWQTRDPKWRPQLIKPAQRSPSPKRYYDDFLGWIKVTGRYRKRRVS